MPEAKAPLSVVILTRNEERNIRGCLESVAWADDVVVLDSLSEDGTVAVAEGMGARVMRRPFDTFAAHRNWALQHIPFRHEWILMLDADDRVTAALAEEIRGVLGSDRAGYYIARDLWFCGRRLRWGGWYPLWCLLLTRRGRARYEERIVHEHVLLDGPAGHLRHPLVNRDEKGLERYFDRHNHYSSMEAVELSRLLDGRTNGSLLKPRLNGSGPERRRWLKQFAYRHLPARPVFKFLWMYLFRLGFLDGRIGLRYCLLQAIYDYQIDLKLGELRQAGSALYERYEHYL